MYSFMLIRKYLIVSSGTTTKSSFSAGHLVVSSDDVLCCWLIAPKFLSDLRLYVPILKPPTALNFFSSRIGALIRSYDGLKDEAEPDYGNDGDEDANERAAFIPILFR